MIAAAKFDRFLVVIFLFLVFLESAPEIRVKI